MQEYSLNTGHTTMNEEPPVITNIRGYALFSEKTCNVGSVYKNMLLTPPKVPCKLLICFYKMLNLY
jgi:hypothetical protein